MTGAEFDGVDIDLLADYIGGALAGTPDESAVAALVADDPAWGAAYESLGGGMALVGAELGRFSPEPMPADLAARLDAMFREAGATGAAATPEPIAGPAAPVAVELTESPVPHLRLVRGDGTPDDPIEHRPERSTPGRAGRRMRWAAPISVAAGLFAFAGFSLDYLVGRSTSDAGLAARDSAAGVPERTQGGDLSAEGLAPGVLVLASGTDYTRSTLGVPPQQPMAAPDDRSVTSSKPAGPPRMVAAEPQLARLTPQAALQSCLQAIQRENAGGTITVQTVDFARFDGAPAVVVYFTADNGQWAWASGPACGTRGSANTLDRVPVR